MKRREKTTQRRVNLSAPMPRCLSCQSVGIVPGSVNLFGQSWSQNNHKRKEIAGESACTYAKFSAQLVKLMQLPILHVNEENDQALILMTDFSLPRESRRSGSCLALLQRHLRGALASGTDRRVLTAFDSNQRCRQCTQCLSQTLSIFTGVSQRKKKLEDPKAILNFWRCLKASKRKSSISHPVPWATELGLGSPWQSIAAMICAMNRGIQPSDSP